MYNIHIIHCTIFPFFVHYVAVSFLVSKLLKNSWMAYPFNILNTNTTCLEYLVSMCCGDVCLPETLFF